MADKYSRFHSNYQRRSVHKRLDGSVITERDWVTIGNRRRLGRGQSAVYGDGNFIFTTSNVPNTKKRHKGSEGYETFKYDDVKDTKTKVDNSSRLVKSKDMRDYAYYGSCQELVRVSVENIMLNFPGRVVGTDEIADSVLHAVKNEEGKVQLVQLQNVYRVNNPFNIDLHHDRVDDIEIAFNTNEMRYLALSKDKYTLNGAAITNFISTPDGVYCRTDGNWYVLWVIQINSTIIYGARQGNNYAYFFPTIENSMKPEDFKLEPKKEVFDEFFNKLNGFEATLLNRNSSTLYKAKLLTPVMGKLDYVYVDRFYTWPSKESYIDIDSPAYYGYVTSLRDIAAMFDEEWSDNLYSRLTHESIKRFDTTFARDYEEGDADDNIEGGERMEKIIRVLGRVFDDIKLSADGIRRTTEIGYGEESDGMDPDTVDDKLELSGWDTVAVSGMFGDKSEWDCSSLYGGIADKTWDSVRVDEEFHRRFLLSARYLNSLKGTLHGIEATLALFGMSADKDFKIREQYRTLGIPTGLVDAATILEKVNNITPYCGFAADVEDDLPNVPLEIVNIGRTNTPTIIPYYRQDKSYPDPDFHFQCAGGWGQMGPDNRYAETLNYMNVVSHFADLLAKSSMDVKENEIYYVVDLSTYPADAELTDDVNLENLSHFFVCAKPSRVSFPDGWTNVNMLDTESDIVKECMYLDSIVNSNFGNNPHTGFGRYDGGESFFDTLKKPFKYVIEHKLDGDILEEAESIEYQIDVTVVDHQDKKEDKITTDGVLKSDPHDEVINADTVGRKVFYNDKRLEIIFNEKTVDMDTFKNYIAPYLMQMIPSTSIVVFKFDNIA